MYEHGSRIVHWNAVFSLFDYQDEKYMLKMMMLHVITFWGLLLVDLKIIMDAKSRK